MPFDLWCLVYAQTLMIGYALWVINSMDFESPPVPSIYTRGPPTHPSPPPHPHRQALVDGFGRRSLWCANMLELRPMTFFNDLADLANRCNQSMTICRSRNECIEIQQRKRFLGLACRLVMLSTYWSLNKMATVVQVTVSNILLNWNCILIQNTDVYF